MVKSSADHGSLNEERPESPARDAFRSDSIATAGAHYRETSVILPHPPNPVMSYSIFLHTQTCQLFAYAEIEDEQKWNAIAQTEICRKWWAYMKEIMPSNSDNSPISADLQEVFHI